MMGADSEMPSSSNAEATIDVGHYRKLVKQYIDMRRYQTALFWAEKVCILSDNDPKDLYCQAQCMFLLKEYIRSAYTIRLHDLHKTHIPSYNLLLECLYEAKEFGEAVKVINAIDIEFLSSSMINQQLGSGCIDIHSVLASEEANKNEILASICYLKGKIYEAMDNRGLAMDFYVQALHKSVYCEEALEALIRHEMLMAWEEKELMDHLPLVQHSSEADAKFIKKLYESKLKKYYQCIDPHSTEEETLISSKETLKWVKEQTEKIQKARTFERKVSPKFVTPKQSEATTTANKVLEDLKNPTPFSLQVSLTRASSLINDSSRSCADTPTRSHHKNTSDNQNLMPLSCCLSRIEQSTDLMAAKAESLFYECEFSRSNDILEKLLHIDPFHKQGLTVQISCWMERTDVEKLFVIGHRLVERYPDKAISWYAAGCYYDTSGKSDPARRYLSKATTLDRTYGPAWLAYGHSFARENEHDQAMAAYFKATQLMRGCHLPLLYIGVECGLTKNLELAEKFFYQAMTIAPLDVFVLHELAVIKYEYNYFENAEEVFRAAADIVKSRAKKNREEVSERWEPLFNNLGHCCRKTKKYEEALEFHQYALLLRPQSAHTYTALGFVHALMGDLDPAVTYFHKSLAICRDCTVTATILKTCVEDLMDDDSILNDICRGINASVLLGGLQGGSANSSSSRSIYRRLPPIDESPPQFSIHRDDEDISTNSDNIDANLIMDMSMDL